MSIQRILCSIATAGVLIGSSPATLPAQDFDQTNLVSNIPGVAAHTDPNLINPWGLSFTATSPFWVADQGSSVSTLYDGAGNPNSLVVSIPVANPPSGPTGTVSNGTTTFLLPDGTKASFFFDTLNGTIAGWNSGEGTTAVTVASTPGAIYTGLSLASSGGSNYLYAADSTGAIRVFDSNFNNVTSTTFAGKFVDPNSTPGYVPFNIQLIGSDLYVTYAELGAGGVPVPGSTGYVDVYDTSGNFIQRFATGGVLDAPWGITLAPAGFGGFGNDLLIGNFGNGEIDAYSTTGAFEGVIDGTNGLPLVNQDLWALDFRTGGANTNPDTLYFTAGIDNQQGGLFGEIATTPEPAPFFLAGLGVLALATSSAIRKNAVKSPICGNRA